MLRAPLACACAALLFAGCLPADAPPKASPHVRHDDGRSNAALVALRDARFADAGRDADAALAADPRDSRSAGVRAIARYQRAGSTFAHDIGALLENGDKLSFLDHEQGRRIWLAFLGELEQVDHDLSVVAADPSFSLELCIACWHHDWNENGRVDDRDDHLFELEFDGNGGELKEGDPRRRPTYRFDVGDASWARAMISFQRAVVELVLAYRWSELDKLFVDEREAVTIKLVDPDRVKRARDLVIAALAYSAQERAAYLAETDDDREWVPSPRQHSYAMPLVVDDQLYAHWNELLGDVQRMLLSQEGLSIRDAVALLDGPERAAEMPDAYVDLGRMFREPKDLVIDFRRDASREDVLRGLLGNGYTKTMRASPLVARLQHMREELDRGQDTIERKLRYLFWLN